MSYLFVKIQVLLVILESGEVTVYVIQTQDRIQALVVVAFAVKGKHYELNYNQHIISN